MLHGGVAAATVELGEDEEVAVYVLTGERVGRRVGLGQPLPPSSAPPFWRNQKPTFVVPPVGSYRSAPK